MSRESPTHFAAENGPESVGLPCSRLSAQCWFVHKL